MRSRAVAVISVSLLVIASASAYQLRAGILHLVGADRPAPGLPALQIGHAWDCPRGWAFKAYSTDWVYYPAYHPAPPRFEVKPARCFQNGADAQRAGFRLAPPPKGGAVFEGVYLIPSSSRVRDECHNAALRIGFPIPCPTLLPIAAADDPCSLNTGCSTDSGQVWDSFSLRILLTTPPELVGAVVNRVGFSATDAASGQLVLTVVGIPLATALGRELNLCSRGRLGPTVMGTSTLWADCTAELPGRPPSLTWLSAGVIYSVATREQNPAIQRLVEFFTSKLVTVGPSEAQDQVPTDGNGP